MLTLQFMYIGCWSFHHFYFRLFALPWLISDHYTTDFYSSETERFWDKLFGATGMLTCVSKPCVLGDVNNRKAVWLASLSSSSRSRWVFNKPPTEQLKIADLPVVSLFPSGTSCTDLSLGSTYVHTCANKLYQDSSAIAHLCGGATFCRV